MAADLAADVVVAAVVGRRAGRSRAPTAPSVGTERVGPGDIAVLVATHRHGALVRDALEAVGVPAVIAGAGSVFGTPVAKEWLALLEALERPSSATRVRAAALSSFVGWSVERVATADDAAWETVYVRLHEWAAILRTRGVASLLETITRQERLTGPAPRPRVDGERELTDLRHIGQLLHHEATTERFGVTALTAWLRARIREAGDDVLDEDRSRRLESDSAAVQVLTIHRCKGLEFPIVYCPFLWQPPWIPDEQLPLFHDATAGGRRTIDVGGPDRTRLRRSPGAARRRGAGRGAAPRLRGAHPGPPPDRAALGEHVGQPPVAARPAALRRRTSTPDAVELAARARRRARSSHGSRRSPRGAPGTISDRDDRADPAVHRWTPAATAPGTLEVRPFDRSFDSSWRRASYSGLTSAAKEQAVDERGRGGRDRRTRRSTSPASSVAAAADGRPTSAWRPSRCRWPRCRAARASARWSTACSSTPTSPPPTSTASCAVRSIDQSGVERRRRDVERTTSCDGLGLAIETPLGPLVGDLRLRDIPTADRLDELTFELPLAGGDAPVGLIRVERARRPPRAAPPARRRRSPATPSTCATRCSTSASAATSPAASTPCSGVRGADGAPRFAVVDYKTNWLGVDGGEITAWDYRPAALATAMDPRPLPAAGAVLRRRPAPLPPLAPARLRPRHPPRRRALPVPPWHGRTPTRRVVDGTRAACSRGARRRALVVAASDLLDRGIGP